MAGEAAVAAAFHRVPAAAARPSAMDLCSCRCRSGCRGGAFASEKRGTGGGRGKEDMCVRTLEKSGGAPSFKLGQTLQPHDAKYETGKQEEERWCVTAWQLSTGKPR